MSNRIPATISTEMSDALQSRAMTEKMDFRIQIACHEISPVGAD